MGARFVAKAQAEFLDQIAYYSETRTGLGTRFAQAVEAAVARAAAFPNAGSPTRSRVRRVLVRRFPFSVVYRPEADGIVVFAIAHHAREPGYWEPRLEP